MFTPTNDQITAYFNAYRKKGGNRSHGDFACNVVKFFDYTFDAYISGIGSRTVAYAHWVNHIGNEFEARLFFDAVDSVESYT
jgi:hypothetical protein